MNEDSEILREIWNGRIPVEFSLAPEEITSSETPQPLYLLVPRVTYFHAAIEKVKRYFKAFKSHNGSDEIWLDYEGCPLKWHYPVGVLYDLLTSTSDTFPWQLTVHFKNFPAEKLMHCHSIECVESQFMQCVKEADQLKHRGAVVSNMQKRDHKQLWNGLSMDKFEQFWSINRRLMDNTVDEPIKFVPIKLYLKNSTEKFPVPVQKLCSPYFEVGELRILGDFLRSVSQTYVEDYLCLAHGIELDLEIPLLWLCINFAYPDNFVHIVLRPKAKS